MSNAGLWPRERPRPTDSHAELKVYDVPSRQLPANWTAWHSLRISFEGKHSFLMVRADSPEIGGNVVADTFLRFKGLERPAVIVTDLGKVTDRFDVRVHIALTRALDAVRVVGGKSQAIGC